MKVELVYEKEMLYLYVLSGIGGLLLLFPPPSPSHPSGSSQCTSPEHPISCIKPGLAICFTSLAPHERLPEILVVPREKTPTGAAARGNP